MKIGTWRLSNHRFTIRVNTDADANVIDAAPVAKRFINRRFEEVCRWMQRIGKTDIILMRSREKH